MKEGYFVNNYDLKSLQNLKEDKKEKKSEKKIKGIVPFVFLNCFWILLFFLIWKGFKKDWKDSFTASSILVFCFSGIWFIGRQEFYFKTRYKICKFNKKLMSRKFKFAYGEDFNIGSFDSYKEIAMNNKKKSQKMFYVTIVYFGLLVLISFILTFVSF